MKNDIYWRIIPQPKLNYNKNRILFSGRNNQAVLPKKEKRQIFIFTDMYYHKKKSGDTEEITFHIPTLVWYILIAFLVAYLGLTGKFLPLLMFVQTLVEYQ